MADDTRKLILNRQSAASDLTMAKMAEQEQAVPTCGICSEPFKNGDVAVQAARWGNPFVGPHRELSTKHAVSDEIFGRAKMLLGEQQLVDLTAVAGTYVTVAMLLAMAEEGVPPGKEAPFAPGDP